MARHIGVISDTHGLLREQIKSRLRGCDTIVHAGDVGSLAVLEDLRRIADVIAVRGNVDTGPWAGELPEIEYRNVGGKEICVVHNIDTLDFDPVGAGIDVVIHGHSHKPALEWKADVLYLNPGSAGPTRFHLPVGLAFLQIGAQGVSAELIAI